MQAATAALEREVGFNGPAAPGDLAATSSPNSRAARVTMTMTPRPGPSPAAAAKWRSVVARVLEAARDLGDGSLLYDSASLNLEVGGGKWRWAETGRAGVGTRTASPALRSGMELYLASHQPVPSPCAHCRPALAPAPHARPTRPAARPAVG
jgi:hypothetical protein